MYFTPSCNPTTMALLVTDSQWFLCHLELIHNICDSYDGQCPYVNGIWVQPYLNPFMFVLFFCLFSGVINVFTLLFQVVQNPRSVNKYLHLQNFLLFLIAKYDRAVFCCCWIFFFLGKIIKQPKILKFVDFTFIHLLKSL